MDFLALATSLIKTEFPQYKNLKIVAVKQQGHDNRSFRLGHNLLIRMPTAPQYAEKVKLEHEWLPKLAKHISLKIPKPLHLGSASAAYPYNWSIYEWLEGESLNLIERNKLNLVEIALTIADFINELHQVNSQNAPQAGKHNFYRGAELKFFYADAIANINKLSASINSQKAIFIMEQALKSKWEKEPVWLHGDLAIGNILLKNGKINAIIDFGGMAVGDPACDLVLYWNLFNGKSQHLFKSRLALEQDVWVRARAMALWKASYELLSIKDRDNKDFKLWSAIMDKILLD